jgi:hypothetical protein
VHPEGLLLDEGWLHRLSVIVFSSKHVWSRSDESWA